MGLHGAIYGDGRVFALLMVYTAASALAAVPGDSRSGKIRVAVRP